MAPESNIRTYQRDRSVVFLKTNEKFGGLSNMAGGFPLLVNGIRILTSEALYQACRFPHLPEVQKLIIGERSPMTAKMKSKPYRQDSRPDWDRVRVKIMRWCLRVKLAQNWRAFSELLLETGERPIVEESRKDDFWGAKPTDEQLLVGMNVLGRLLMELREEIKAGSQVSLLRVEPLAIPDFLLNGMPIAPVFGSEVTRKVIEPLAGSSTNVAADNAMPQRLLFDPPAVNDGTPPVYFDAERKRSLVEDLKPYQEYKESEQAWLGCVPKHWRLLPNRSLFEEVKDRDRPNEQMLSVTIVHGIVPQKALLADSSKKDSSRQDKSAYKLVQPNDIAYNKMRAWQGAIGVSELRGIISPAYIVQRLREGANVPRYFHHLYRTPQFAKEAERWSYGITSDMWSLRPEHFKLIYTPLPPSAEQTAIVRFLDWANARLEQAIRAKRKVIALLNERKQAIVHRAVTRGLNPSVPLKPSGIPWLGDIPRHWEVVRNMALFRHRVEPGCAGLPVLQVSLRSGITTEELDHFGRPKRLIADETKYKRIYKGDVAYNTMRMWQGAVGVAPNDGLVSPAYVVLSPRQDTCADFYDLIFHTDVYKQQVNRQSTGIVSDRNRLYWDSFKQMQNVALPRPEQESIVAFVTSETEDLNTAASRLQSEIELLREYRTRLVADVVTGKLDVREAAARLPEDRAPEIGEDEMELEGEIEVSDEEAAA